MPGPHLDDDGRGHATLDPSWHSWGSPHGGLLAALLLRTASSLVPTDQEPRALAVQFLAARASRDDVEVCDDGGTLLAPSRQTRRMLGDLVLSRP